MHVFALGASRATGYHAALEYLARGYVVTILLRSPAVLQEDPAFKQYLADKHAILVKGDATNEGDVVRAWKVANEGTSVDLVLFSLGPAAKFKLFQGFVTDTPNLSSITFLYTMRAIAQTTAEATAPVPRIVVVSAKSVTPSALALDPAPVRLIIGWVLRVVNIDKRGMEAIAFHGLGKEYEKDMTPGEPILPNGWEETLPPTGWAKRMVVVRPPQLTDGPATGKYRTSVKDVQVRKLSRRDLGGFIAGPLEDKWDEFAGGIVNIGY